MSSQIGAPEIGYNASVASFHAATANRIDGDGRTTTPTAATISAHPVTVIALLGNPTTANCDARSALPVIAASAPWPRRSSAVVQVSTRAIAPGDAVVRRSGRYADQAAARRGQPNMQKSASGTP